MISPGLVRLLLATLVVVHHLSKFSVGSSAVYLFFVLSGFWVYRMYDGKYARANSPRLLFVTSRLMRLLPTFLMFNLLAIFLHAALQDETASSQSLVGIVPNL